MSDDRIVLIGKDDFRIESRYKKCERGFVLSEGDILCADPDVAGSIIMEALKRQVTEYKPADGKVLLRIEYLTEREPSCVNGKTTTE